MSGRIHDPVRTYSHGMRQRLGLAQALLPAPELVLLDEPTEGLDPEGIHEMRHLILQLSRDRGLTVLLSSHLLSEIEQMCDRVAILNQGRLVFSGRWETLRSEVPRYRLELDDWTKVPACGGRMVANEVVELAEGADVAELVAALVRSGVKVRAVEPVRRSLEAIYLGLIGAKEGGKE